MSSFPSFGGRGPLREFSESHECSLRPYKHTHTALIRSDFTGIGGFLYLLASVPKAPH